MTPLNPFQTSVAEWYHEETKYTEEGLRRDADHSGLPDPDRQPVPFKSIDLPRVALPVEGLPFRRDESIEVPGGEDLVRLSRVLWHTYGCTRIVKYPGGIHPFRAAPSAGAMYPTEVYVALRDFEGAADGIYNYQLLEHSLATVRDENVFPALSGALFGHPAAGEARAMVFLTAEWYRSSWRYRERGYRRCLLDTGHVLGNLFAIAPAEGFEPVPFGVFVDEVLEGLIGVDPVDEGVLVAVPLLESDDPVARERPALRASPATERRAALEAVGDRLPADAPERSFVALHLSSRLGPEAPEADRTKWPAPPDRAGGVEIPVDTAPTEFSGEGNIGSVIATRRSTRAFRPGPVSRQGLFRALAYSEPGDRRGLFAPELLRTWLVVVDVEGLPPGSYAVERDPLRLVERERRHFAVELLHLGLGQQILHNAAAALIHTVDLPRAVGLLGDRAYRLLKLDAGHVGERMNLALLREGIGVSGCGGYLDDEMNRVLGIPENQAVIYITVLGAPAD